VVHLTAVYNFPTLPTLFFARKYAKPLVWSPRGTLQRWGGSRRVRAKALWESACRGLLPRTTALHATSEEEASESAPRLGNPPAWIIPNGVAIPNRPIAPPQDGILKLLFMGRLDPKKGIENLIQAAAIACSSRSINCRLTIAGQGDPGYVTTLRNLVSSAGLSARVDFCGFLEGPQKYRLFERNDVVVVPSYTENFGLVVAEALAHARPVIASRGTPWRELESRGCGLWVDNDPVSLAQALDKISQSDRAAMGQRGRDWMSESFSWRERAERMLSLYQHLLRAA
jgi:glycosyltransferase involved in cell wall biosynthesis